MTDSLSIAVHAFASHVSMSVLVDETLLPKLVNLSTSFSNTSTKHLTHNNLKIIDEKNLANYLKELSESSINYRLQIFNDVWKSSDTPKI